MSWYAQRAEDANGVQAQREPIEKAIYHFRNAIHEPHHELESVLHLCRSLIFKGRFVETESKLRSQALGEAKDIAEKYLPKYPNNRDLRFEHLAALGLWGESLGIFRAAKEGIATRMRVACEQMIALDPEFMNGVGRRSLGVLNYKVPSIPFIITWPDKKKSLALLKQVMKEYPDDISNNFYFAEFMFEHGDKQEAEQHLLRVLAFSPDKEHLLEHRLMHMEAKRLLDRIKGR